MKFNHFYHRLKEELDIQKINPQTYVKKDIQRFQINIKIFFIFTETLQKMVAKLVPLLLILQS